MNDIAATGVLKPFGDDAYWRRKASEPVGRPIVGREDHRLRAIEEEFAGPRRIIEKVFLQMGEGLAASTTLLGEISAAHEAMPAEFASPAFTAAVRHLEDIREQVNAMAAAHFGEQDHINELADMTRGVGSPISELCKAVRAIGQIAINARIVAASFGSNNGDVAAFTSDMSELAKSVNEAVGAFSRSYQALVSSLAAARTANAAFTARHGGTMTHISGEITAQLSAVDCHQTLAAAKVVERSKLTSQIRTRIGNAVFALQIGDITRQRVEHVEEAFEALQALEARSGDAASCVTFAAICHLQGLQLDETIGEFDAKVIDLAATLNQLARDAAVVLQESNDEAGTLLSAGGTALATMIADLRAICVLFREFERTRLGLEQIVDDVAQSVAAMVRHLDSIHAIERHIRLLSFNATIQCSRVDDEEQGRALRVVAQQLRELSRQTVVAAGAIMAGLKEADARTRLLMEGKSSLVAEQITVLREAAIAAIDMFEAVVDRLRVDAETMQAVGTRAVQLLETTAESISNRQRFSDDWHRARAEIDGLIQGIPDRFDPAVVDPSLLAELRARYTMEDERRIHDKLFGVTSDLVAPPIAATGADDNVDDVFL